MRRSEEPSKRRSIPVRPSSLGGRASVSTTSAQKSKLPLPRTSQNPPSAYKLKRTGSFANDYGKQSLPSSVAQTPFQTPRASAFHTPGSISSAAFASASKSTVRKKDGPSFNDKAHQRQLLQKVHNFFEMQGLPDAAERFHGGLKMDKREFTRLLMLFFDHLAPGSKINFDVEKDVTELLKKIGCFNISFAKGSFSAIGAPHSVGYFLGLFSWLIDIWEGVPPGGHDEDLLSYVKFKFHERMKNLYGKWLMGMDNFDADFADWCQFLDSVGVSQESFESSLRNVQAKQREFESIKAEIEQLQSQTDMASICDGLSADKNSLQEYVEAAYKYNQEVLQENLIQTRERNLLKKKRLEELLRQKEELRERFKNQPLTKRDFEVQRQQIVELKSNIGLERETLRTIKDETASLEVSYAKALEECNQCISQFRSKARSAGLIPQTGEISFDPQDYSAGGQQERWSTEVEPAMRRILAEKKRRAEEYLEDAREREVEIAEVETQIEHFENEVKECHFKNQFMESEMLDLLRLEQEEDEKHSRCRRVYAEVRRKVEEHRQELMLLKEKYQELAAQKEEKLTEIAKLDEQLGQGVVSVVDEGMREAKNIHLAVEQAEEKIDKVWINKLREMMKVMEGLKETGPDAVVFVNKIYEDFPLLKELK